MVTFAVRFDTKSRRKACSTSVRVSAASEQDAIVVASRLLRQSGENLANFNPPAARPESAEAA